MKPHNQKLTLAFMSGIFALGAGSWALFFVMSDMPNAAIGTGIVSAFCALFTKIQLHDRERLIIRAKRRAPEDSNDWQYEKIVGPKL